MAWLAYNDLVKGKKASSEIVMSVIGVENENALIDLMVLDRPSEMNALLPEYLKEQSFLKRRVRVTKDLKIQRSFTGDALC